MNNDNYSNNTNNNNSLGKIRLEHVISFSDAIFAFSITFMAISIQIPNLPQNNLTQLQVISTLSELVHNLRSMR